MMVCMCATKQPGSVVMVACLLSDCSCYHHAVHLCPFLSAVFPSPPLPFLLPLILCFPPHRLLPLFLFFIHSLPSSSSFSTHSFFAPHSPPPSHSSPPPAIFPLFYLPPPLPYMTKDVAITYLKVHQGTSDAAYITSHNRVLVRAGKGPSVLSIHQKLAYALYIRLDFQVLNGSTYPPALNFSRYSSHENMAHSSSLCVCVCVTLYVCVYT